jgi:amino acid adenylation domain-containing protein
MHDSLVSILRWRAEQQSERPGYTFLGEGVADELCLSYAQLDRRARRIAALLQQVKATGERALLLYPPGSDYVAAFFGCLYAGVIAVPAYPPRLGQNQRSLQRLQAIAKDARPLVALTTAPILSVVEPLSADDPHFKGLRWLATDLPDDDLADAWLPPTITATTIALLQYTSGSTALPKGVVLRHGNLLHNSAHIQRCFDHSAESFGVSWLPPYHDMGLIGGIIQPLYAGFPVVLMPPITFLQRPARWLEAISRYGATTSGGPNFAYELCVRKIPVEQRTTLDLRRWRVATSGAEPVRAETLDRFVAAFGPCGFRRETFYPSYGLAEATLIVSGGGTDDPPVVESFDRAALKHNHAVVAAPSDQQTQTLVGCGKTMVGQQIVIARPDTLTTCAPGEIGEIWVGGSSVAAGYWNRPEATAQTFGAYLADTGAGPFLRTGDLGFLHAGELFVTGRCKDLIIIRGRNHYPQDLELTAEQSHPALRPGSSAAFTVEIADEERLVVVQEVERQHRMTIDINAVADAIRQAVAAEHDVQVYAVTLVKPGALPKTSSGKIQRQASRAQWLSHSLQTLGDSVLDDTPTAEPDPPLTAEALRALAPAERQPALEGYLTAQLARALGITAATIDRQRPITTLGIDSLAAVEVQYQLETDLSISVPMVTFLKDRSIVELAAEIAPQLAAPSGPSHSMIASDQTASGPSSLAYGQRALWFLHQLKPESGTYNIVAAVQIGADLDSSLLEHAFQQLVDRHPALRTTFGSVNGEPFQHVHQRMHFRIELVDAAAWNETTLNERLVAAAYAPFDLSYTPPLRVQLYRRSDQTYILLLAIHHIIADFWSLDVLTRELGLIYQAEQQAQTARLAPLTITDYAHRESRMLAEAAGERLWQYWQRQLADVPALLDLPVDYPRPPIQTDHGATHRFTVAPALSRQIKQLAQANGATLYTTLLAAFQVLLYRYTGQQDLVVGSPSAGRGGMELSDMIGYFVNPVALRANLSGNPPFTTLLSQVRQTVLAALEHQAYPFPLLVERLDLARFPNRTPLFQVMFVVQKASSRRDVGLTKLALGVPGAEIRIGNLAAEIYPLEQRVARFDLTLTLGDVGDELAGVLEYNTDLFKPTTIERMAGHFQTLLQNIAANPEQGVADIPLLPGAERDQMLMLSRATATYPQQACLHQLVAAQALRTPDAVAVVYEEQHLTYAMLCRRANQLAHYLRALGVGQNPEREVRVGVCLERSPELVVALLGILTAGGCYVPLDPAYPPERLRFMLEDAEAPLLITQQSLAGSLDEWQTGSSARIICLDRDQPQTGTMRVPMPEGHPVPQPADAPASLVLPESAAYIIYTSGSTGRPKGVVVSHANVTRLLAATAEWFGFGPADVWTLFHSYAFDFSVWELWAPLCTGGRVVVVPYWVSRAPEAFYQLLQREHVTVLNQTPTAFRQLMQAEATSTADLALRWVIFGGEALEPHALRPWFERHGDQQPQLVNMYGITETTVHVSYRPLSWADVTSGSVIGQAIPDLEVYLLDARMEPVPWGVAGELYVGGAGVARGYLNRPDLTAERFVPHPFSQEAGARLYKSGDLARRLAHGDLEYLGRSDQQVKIRGFRIEPGEIEAVLMQHPQVQEAVVIARSDAGQDRQLIAYIVLRAEQTLTISEAREFLGERLPDHMIPAAFVTLDTLPLTLNGKLDRAALPMPDRQLTDTVFVAPRTPTEAIIAQIWADVLRHAPIGVYDNFFALGGHSLLAVQVLSRLHDTFQITIPLHTLFNMPTIAALSVVVEAAMLHRSPSNGTIIPRRTPDEAAPLSSQQQRLWFVDQLDPGSAVYNIPGIIRLSGTLNVAALEHSLHQIICRHESLRTSFVSIDGVPKQHVDSAMLVPLHRIDLRDLLAAEQADLMRQRALEEAQTPFDLAQGPLLRTTLVQLGAAEHLLLVTMHHIISDGWSIGVFVRELSALYTAFSADKPSLPAELPIQYADYALWQRQQAQSAFLAEHLRYWQEQLADLPTLQLPTDRPRPVFQTFAGAKHHLRLSAQLSRQLKTLGQREDSTLFMTLLAAWQILLYRYSHQDDIVVGSVTAGRTRRELEDLIGFFVDNLVLRTDLSGNPSFRELLRRTRATCLDAFAHQAVPFVQLVEILQPERDLSRSPLFQVMFVLQSNPIDSVQLPELTLTLEEGETATTKFDLTLNLEDRPDALCGWIEYNCGLFDAATIARMAGHFEILLTAIVDQPEQQIGHFSILSDLERAQLLHEWNATEAAYPEDRTIHQLFEEQARRTPEQIAVISADTRLTYRELDRRANQLADRLRASGVGPDTLVGVCLERSPDMLVAILAVLKADGAYVPLDPAYPQERLAFMVADAQLRLLLTDQQVADRLPPTQARTICLDAVDQAAFISPDTDSPPRSQATAQPDHLAYLIYTSGSTGRPKGVAITHRNAVAMITWALSRFSAEDLRGMLASTSICFDLSIFELFTPLSSGGSIILAAHALQLPYLPASHAVTLINTVPSVMTELLQTGALPPSVRVVNLAGEPLPASLAQQIHRQLPLRRLFNLYGPSEDTTYSTCAEITADTTTPSIGRPIANTQVTILDGRLQLVPVGVAGELHLSGLGLARGYFNHPDLTAERFIPSPFTPGARLYRTGDLARWLPDGTIEYLGRIDHQVKIRGFRIELGEIESALRQHPMVRESVVIAREEIGSAKRLVAYVVGEQKNNGTDVDNVSALSAADLRDFLLQKLPAYMLPAVYIFLDSLPLTPNGKLDRRALPQPDANLTQPGRAYVAPRTVEEEMLANIWAGILGLEQVGIHDHFFELGGHSLLATQVAARVRDLFQVELPLRTIFLSPTVAGLAEWIAGKQRDQERLLLPPLRPVAHDHEPPLSFAQQRLWFLHQIQPDSTSYSLPAAVRLIGTLDVAALEQSLNAIVQRHETLRTTFAGYAAAGQPTQRIAPTIDLPLLLHDLTHLPPDARDAELRRQMALAVQQPFDLAAGPLLRVLVLRLEQSEHVLLLVMHHIIADGWSLGVLIREMSIYYTAAVTKQPADLPELTIQYADYAIWQRQWLQSAVLEQQLAYWRQQLAGAPPILALPTDRPRPPVPSFRGAAQPLALSATLTDSLKRLSRQEGCTLFMTLLAAFQALLSQYSGQHDIVVGSPIANRNLSETESLIGFFVNTLVLRGDLSGNPSFQQLLRRTRTTTLGAYAHQDLPFEQLVEELKPPRDPSYTPLFQVMFALQNAPMPDVALAGLSIERMDVEVGTAKFDLSLTFEDTPQGLKGSLEYSADLFDAATITRLAGYFTRLLEEIITDPEQRLSQISLLSDAERRLVLDTWNASEAAYADDRCMHQCFEAQAILTPEAIAVEYKGQTLTYADLNRRANQLAHYLRARGVGECPQSQVSVGICVERSLELVVGFLGILKAGGVYVPLDPNHPQERLAFMLADSQIRLLLTQERLRDRLPDQSVSQVYLDTDWAAISGEAQTNPVCVTTPDHLAYIIYTSGSTGQPKGVMLAHRGLVNLKEDQLKLVDMGVGSRVLQCASSSFDASIWELASTLLSGATLCMVDRDDLLPGPNLITLLREQSISHALLLPSTLALLPPADLPLLTTLSTGAEKPSAELVARWQPGRRLLNLYGPTETTIFSTVFQCTALAPHDPPIGRPIANTQVYLLNSQLQPVPIGVVGEIYIGGVGVARGYLNRPELTAERFIAHPFSQTPGARLYKTGDLARYLPDGNIMYIGRSDHQVKVRGFRIELGEIEHVLTSDPAVRTSIVQVRETTSGRQIVAYVVCEPDHALDVLTLRNIATARLPEYMVPNTFVMLDQLPLTPNGKIDYAALPMPGGIRPNLAAAYIAPRTELEAVIASMWQELLHVDQVGLYDNFFDLGGHSLIIVQLHARLSERFNLNLSMIDLFKYPTISALSEYLSQAEADRVKPLLPEHQHKTVKEGRNWLKQRLGHPRRTDQKE